MPGIVKLTNTDAAYIAGILDGEASFGLGKPRRVKSGHCARRGFNWSIRISLGMTEKGAIEFISQKFNKTFREKPAKSDGGKPLYQIALFSGELRQTLPRILPFLKIKVPQAKLLEEAISIIGSKSNELVDRRLEEIFSALKQLNKKGRRTSY